MTDATPPMFIMLKPTAVQQAGGPSSYLCSVELISAVIDKIYRRRQIHREVDQELIQRAMTDHSANVMGAGFMAILSLVGLKTVCKGFAHIQSREPSFYRVFYPDHDPSDSSPLASAIHQNNAGWVHVDAIDCLHPVSASAACLWCVVEIQQLKVAFRDAAQATVPRVSGAGERDNLVHSPGSPEELAVQWRYLARRLVSRIPTGDPRTG
jgi:hypothetical protein